MSDKQKVNYKLVEPVQYGSETIEEFNFRPLKGKDFRSLPMDLNNMTMGTILDLAAKLAGVAPSVIDELSAEDIVGVSEVMAGFMPAGLEIGKTR